MNNTQYKTKCSFCKYATSSGCMVTPSKYYCKEATDEYFQYIQKAKQNTIVQKSLRSWNKNR